MKKISKNGITLIEVLIIIVILIAILYLGSGGGCQSRHSKRNARRNTCICNLRAINHASMLYKIDNKLDENILIELDKLWPSNENIKDSNSYIEKQLHCPSGGIYVKESMKYKNKNLPKPLPHCVTKNKITNLETEFEHSLESQDDL